MNEGASGAGHQHWFGLDVDLSQAITEPRKVG